MAEIVREVYLLQKRRIAPIDITYGCAVPIRLAMMDLTVPADAAIDFYAQQQSGSVYHCAGSASGNSAVFTPPEGFFREGENLLQLEINGSLIPIALPVICHERLSGVGSEETPEMVKPYVVQCQEILAQTKAAAVKTPYVGANNNWFVYDADRGAYVDSGVGAVGPKGDAFKYSDFTADQLAALKGEKGDAFKYEDFTADQLAALKGDKGDPFEYDDFTPEQLAALKGNTGDPATLTSQETVYQASASGTDIPAGAWTSSIPEVAQGQYLWTRVTTKFNTGDPVVSYSVSRMGVDGSGSVVSVCGVSPDDNGNVVLGADDIIGAAEAPKTVSGAVIAVDDASDSPLQSLKIYGRTTQDGTPTPEAPVELVSVGDSGSIGVSVCGKNLLPNAATTNTINGVTFTVNADGSVTANGTATANATLILKAGRGWILGGDYIGTGCPSGGSSSTYWIRFNDATATKSFNDKGSGVSVKFTDNAYFSAQITVLSGITVSNLLFYPMLRSASITDATYEPYNAQTLTAITPNGLPGIPVASGGNYTDADGQHWICDEVDFAKGVYVQRLGKIDSYSSEDVGSAYMSTTGDLSTGATVIYPLDTPVETALSASELAAYAALHTNKPNTTIYNDAVAYMDVGYYTPNATMLEPDIRKLADSVKDAALLKTGGTMTGAIAMGGNKITGLGTPTAASDAAPKSYVDGINAVPASTTADNGKFLRVVDGSAAWQTVQAAEEVSV